MFLFSSSNKGEVFQELAGDDCGGMVMTTLAAY